MRHVRLRTLIFGLAVAAVGIAGALAVATSGRAASGNICNQPTTSTHPYASCVQQFVLPHYVTAVTDTSMPAATGVAITKFHNESGPSGATATHTVVSVAIPAGVTVNSFVVFVNGSQQPSSACTQPTTSTVACAVGNISGDGLVKVVVYFSAPRVTGDYQFVGTANYGEGGGNPSNVPNDNQVNVDTLHVVASGAQGSCFTGSWNVAGTRLTPDSKLSQTTNAAGGLGNGTDGLNCAYADAGVFSPAVVGTPTGIPVGGHTQVSFVEFPVQFSGFATVALQWNPLPAPLNWKTFTLNESLNGQTITVLPCGANGLPTVAGADSCIFNRSTLPKGGAEIDMHVTGAPGDGSYWG
jgi:hypothetical protein